MCACAGTAEVESSLDEHPACAEAAVVGYPHAIKGEGIYAFVTLKASAGENGCVDVETIRTQLKNQVCVYVCVVVHMYAVCGFVCLWRELVCCM